MTWPGYARPPVQDVSIDPEESQRRAETARRIRHSRSSSSSTPHGCSWGNHDAYVRGEIDEEESRHRPGVAAFHLGAYPMLTPALSCSSCCKR